MMTVVIIGFIFVLLISGMLLFTWLQESDHPDRNGEYFDD